MDLTIVEDEISDYNNTFFKEYSTYLTDSIQFIEQNKLTIPKENYTILFEYVSNLYYHFRNSDNRPIDTTLSKLFLDVKNLHQIHNEIKDKCSNITELFNNKFIHYSPAINSLQKEINVYNNIVNISMDEKKVLKKHLSTLNKLKAIYLEKFIDFFTEDMNYYTSILMMSLNSKIYYLDKFIWIKVSQSGSVTSAIKNIDPSKEISSKEYIEHKLTVIMPYSKEYIHLQKCLRIFK